MARAARAVERETEEHSVERDTNPGTRRFSRRRAAALRHVIAGTVLSIVSQRYATGDHTRKRTDVKTTGRGESMARADKSYMRVACRGRAIGRLGIVQRYIMGVFEGAMERGTGEWRSAEGRSLRNARGGRRGNSRGRGACKQHRHEYPNKKGGIGRPRHPVWLWGPATTDAGGRSYWRRWQEPKAPNGVPGGMFAAGSKNEEAVDSGAPAPVSYHALSVATLPGVGWWSGEALIIDVFAGLAPAVGWWCPCCTYTSRR
jgi:hypothetical protein